MRSDDEIRADVAWLMYCLAQGYANVEDRAFLTNWLLENPSTLHPTDAALRPHLLAMADEVIAAAGTPLRDRAVAAERDRDAALDRERQVIERWRWQADRADRAEAALDAVRALPHADWCCSKGCVQHDESYACPCRDAPYHCTCFLAVVLAVIDAAAQPEPTLELPPKVVDAPLDFVMLDAELHGTAPTSDSGRQA